MTRPVDGTGKRGGDMSTKGGSAGRSGRSSSVRPGRPYIPQDQLTGSSPDFALAADLIELTAFTSSDDRALLSELTSALEIGQDEYENLEDVLLTRERITTETTAEIEMRARQLGKAYPFSLDEAGSTLAFEASANWGRSLYILSLILSHLPSERSPVLEQARLLPSDREIIMLRRWFQYCATASVAAEISGDAWAFGWPRPDHSGFMKKLRVIWSHLKDGDVRDAPLPGSPEHVKDDEIDIIAARLSCDGMHGFPIILGQVASGNNWRSKPLRSHALEVFYPEWFSTLPASQTLIYHIIPFVVDRTAFRRETRRLGHLMHRVRLCTRALEAHQAVDRGAQIKIEGTEAFNEFARWAEDYRTRARTPWDRAVSRDKKQES